MADILKILAVGDPAVDAYVDKKHGIIDNYIRQTGKEVVFDIIPWDSYYTSMTDVFSGKTDYDIAMVAGHMWSKDFVNKGYISEVKYPVDEVYDIDDILPVIMDEMKVDGKTYLYPSFCDGHIVLYRKSAVKKVLGKEIDAIITTDKLIEIAAMAHGTDNMAGIALKAHSSEIFLDVLPYFRNEGISIFDQEGNPDFNSSNAVIALEKYLSLRQYAPCDSANYGNDQVRTAFQQKKTILAVTWGGQLGVVMNEACCDPDDVGYAILNTSWNVTWSFAVNKKSNKKDEANEFLAYITSKNIDRIVGGHAGSPVRSSSYIADKSKYPWYSCHLEMIRNYAKPLPKMLDAGTKLGYLYSEIYQAFINNKSAEKALEDAYKALTLLY